MKKIILLVAGIIGIVVLVAAILLYINRDKITNFAADRTLNYVEMQVMQHVADPHRADSVRTDFAMLHERLRAGTVKSSDVKDLAALFYTSYKNGKLDSAEVRQILGKIHDLVRER
jgi:methionine salvage enolase-phosphatase E1